MRNLSTGSRDINSFEAVKVDREYCYLKPYKPNEIKHNSFTEADRSATHCRLEKNDVTPTWSQNLRSYIAQYCDVTTIHGVRYIGERGRLAIEKAVWTIIVIAVCVFCVLLIRNAYHKWITSPVMVTFAAKETEIWKIPFPAVTICPETRSDPEVFNYTDVFIKKFTGVNVSERERQYFETFSLICTDGVRELADSIANSNLTTFDQVYSDLFTAFPNLDPYNISTIYWLGKVYSLEEALTWSLTKDGLCYSFNMLPYEEIYRDPGDGLANRSLQSAKSQKWSLEDGYPDDNEQNSFPRRTFLSGMNGGFIFDGLYADKSHLDYVCSDALQGFKIILHHPSELPDIDKHFRVPLDHAVVVAIRPTMIYVAEELKSYHPEDRHCYFAHEKYLANFNSYTQQHCLEECLWNYTLSKCGCVAFYMQGLDNVNVCGPGSNDCLERNREEYVSYASSICNCLPFCTALEYDVEITQTSWEWSKVIDLFRLLPGKEAELSDADKRFHMSKLVVFYKDLQFLPSERHEVYGFTDFFSNVGGLLGLFIGFSVISFLEILYFLSLRIVCNVRKFGQNLWSGDPELGTAKQR